MGDVHVWRAGDEVFVCREVLREKRKVTQHLALVWGHPVWVHPRKDAPISAFVSAPETICDLKTPPRKMEGL